jgi:glycosyltransferase involved in cell wall biosynthesis
MQVTVSVGGRFHAFDMAGQLHKRGFLRTLITSYPKFKAAEWDIPQSKVETILSHEILSRGVRKLNRNDLQYPLNVRFDRIASQRIPKDTKLLVAWSGMALKSLEAATRLGATTVVERGSTHIAYQDRLLREECELTGARAGFPDPRTMDQERQEYDKADYIGIPSSFVYKSFIDSGIAAEKLLLAPFGVDTHQFRPVPKQDSIFRVIHCGSLTIRKGIHYLLQAFHELNLKNAELWLIGAISPEAITYLERYGGPNVILRGTFPQAELYKQYSQGSVLCAASIEDGLAMVVPQAMACELSIVCTPNTGAAGLVRDGVDGFIVPIRDVHALKEKLSYLYSHPQEALAMGAMARQRILDGYTWDHYGNRLVDQYARVLTGSSGQLSQGVT